MLEKMEFVYDGIPSSYYGVICANPSGGLYQEPLVASTSILEDKIRHRPKPYFQGIERQPLSFPLRLYVDEKLLENSPYDTIDIDAIANWIKPSFYKPFYYSEVQDKLYYCVPTQDINYIHAGLESQGYIDLTMRCNDAYVYSPTYLSSQYDYSNNPSGGTEYIFANNGDVSLFPEIQITKIGVGDISITNNSNGGVILQFTSLADQEQVYVDNENEDIISDIPGQYRYDNFNFNWLEIVPGDNHLQIEGNCKIQWRYFYKWNR